ncbi:M48 family metalloprotease [Streptomyces sp. DW26H14]|uniref:M48 family metalloprotease n=1 Tax=Streptomyces sp. DW26H14 TaxID=3435395 RepID=UPI00403DC433
MIALLVLPLLLPCAAPRLARGLAGRLEPTAALWALTVAAVVLGGSTVAALLGLVLAGALRLPVVARLGKMIHPMATGPAYVVVPAAVLAAAALVACAGTAVRSAARERRALRVAHAEADRARAAHGLCVVADDRIDAYALPGRPRPGRVVVTEGMLDCLGADECDALVAHERAHLAGRHHLFLAAAELSRHCHPGLRVLREDVALAAERAADEAAARATGDRRLTARAVGRAALAAHAAPVQRGSVLPSATAGPVPQRVAALLNRPEPAGWRPFAASFAVLLLLCAGASSAAALTGAVDLHSGVEVAQGESTAHHHLPR